MNPLLLYATMMGIWVGLLTLPVKAEPVLIRKGYICDTLDQLTDALSQVTPTDQQLPDVDGCGHLQRPMPATVEPLHVLTTDRFEVGLVRLTFPPPLGVQYSYAAWRPRLPEL